MSSKKNLANILEQIRSIPEKPILTASIVLGILAVMVFGLSFSYYAAAGNGFYQSILAEAHGMLFDIAIIGILLYWLNQNGQTRQRIRTYKDEIDDFRLWESEEAAFRTVGNIKRLNRNGIHDINLVNTYLLMTNLNYVNLESSNMNNANLTSSKLIESNLRNSRLNQTNFENANLNQACLEGAYASGANFKDAFLIKANLNNAFLIKADFRNAFLMEASLNGAHMTGADLENANLYKADFRNADGLTVEQFANVKSLYLAKFDNDFDLKVLEAYPELLGK